MSRRDSSRVHVAVRQSDGLADFENFKKKFLFANKQITKQNCSLSLKIEELNAHISTLYVENLRLRASEIALQTELKREKLKCHKIMSDAEAATENLLKHFGIIRSSYNVSAHQPPSPKDGSDNDSPGSGGRLQKPPPRSPSAPRYAALPSVPDIPEEHEQESSQELEEAEYYRIPSKKSSRRQNISQLPDPSRASSPPTIDWSAEESVGRKRKLARRPSGLMTTPEPIARPISPVLGSPMQDIVNLSVEEEAAALQDVEEIAAREEELEREAALRKARRRERARSRDEEDFSVLADGKEKKKSLKDRSDASSTRLKDVTNSPRRKRSPPNADSASEDNVTSRSKRPTLTISPQLISPPAIDEFGYLPTPLPSSVSNTPNVQQSALPTSDVEPTNGIRERRTRKSVNYAEPKLNTKMRKPDSIAPPGARPSLISAQSEPSTLPSSSFIPSQTSALHRRSSSSPEVEQVEPTRKAVEHRRSASSLISNARSAAPSSSSGFSTPAVGVGIGSKRKRLGKPMYEEDDEEYVPSGSTRPLRISSSKALQDDDEHAEESDDGDADAEYAELRAWAGGLHSRALEMANVGSRRRSTAQTGTGSGRETDGGKASTRRSTKDLGDTRRHSVAV